MTARLLEFLAVISLSSCASFYPVTKTRLPDVSQEIELTPFAGRGDSLSLKIRTNITTAEDMVFLEVFRSQDDAEPEVIQEILLDENTRQRLVEGITIVDRDLEVGTTYLYFIGSHGGTESFSNVWQTTWRNAPTTPESMQSATVVGAVTIRWRDDGYRCHVLRRNVLVDNAPTITVAEIPSGNAEWVDTSVRPGDVFTYQIVFVRRNVERTTVWEHLGHTTESMYVTVEAP